MTELTQESRKFIERLVASGAYESRAAAMEAAVQQMRTALECATDGGARPGRVSPEEWCEQFERWAAGHRAQTLEADDSRDSIYAGRGE